MCYMPIMMLQMAVTSAVLISLSPLMSAFSAGKLESAPLMM